VRHYVITIFVIAYTGAGLQCLLTALCRDKKGSLGCEERATDRYSTSTRVKSRVVYFEPIAGDRSVERHRKGCGLLLSRCTPTAYLCALNPQG
jgi:hypothetical protein